MNAQKPKLIVIAGPNGSGKTSVTRKILKHDWMDGCVYINPDDIARDKFGDWNSPDAVMQAARHATEIRHKCLNNKESLLFETVLSAPEKIEFIEKAKMAGFFIRLFFVGTESPAINASRITQRVMQGGHDVPIPKIISRYSKSIANCAIAAMVADRTYVYDNSIDFADPTLLFRVNDGKLEKVYVEKVNLWAKEILKIIEEAS